ncbi:MAG: WYL domain-containing protein [Burkholderiales bacterium]|nr:WYL domain-containing protein [Burkholderiales bacterium]
MRRCCKRSRSLSVINLRTGKDLTEYVVNPLSLVVRNSIVYLVCTMWDYKEVRQLALHRVRKAELLDSASVMTTGFDIDAYIAQGEFGFRRHHRAGSGVYEGSRFADC